MKDPISNSNVTVAMLKEHCDGVIIRELEAGKYNLIYSYFCLDQLREWEERRI